MPDKLEQILMPLRSARFDTGQRKTLTVCFFDLVGSTEGKLRGQKRGVEVSILHNKLCRKVVSNTQGSVIKELGDGLLAVFEDSVHACLAALDIRTGARMLRLRGTKCGIAHGTVQYLSLDRTKDVLGDTVDRAARIQSLAQNNQILVDRATYDATRSSLLEERTATLSGPLSTWAKGLGDIEVYEIISSGARSRGLAAHLRIHEEGRLDLPDKVAFIRDAKQHVIELGVGLTTFADYFKSRRPSEFRKPVEDLLKRGVRFTCLALDPAWPYARAYSSDRGDDGYVSETKRVLETLKLIGHDFSLLDITGLFECRVYRHFPQFHAVAVDPLDPKNGRLTVSNYLFNVLRSHTPVIQFTRKSNPQLFDRYWKSIKSLLDNSRRA